MFIVGGYYITIKGRLAKIVSKFEYADAGHFQIAVRHHQQGWIADRLRADGTSMTNADHNIKDSDDFKGFLTFCKTVILYDKEVKSWLGLLYDLHGAELIKLNGIESQERTLKLLQLGAQEKILTWMQESGYVDEEMDEGAE